MTTKKFLAAMFIPCASVVAVGLSAPASASPLQPIDDCYTISTKQGCVGEQEWNDFQHGMACAARFGINPITGIGNLANADYRRECLGL
ncbi:hypothetical protein ACIBCN_25765 [Nocardia sp. NPDC051052]|uniref:hypothetical protein n=1 Tax=Nocardia sp. NPDC051052 TaxID=3364322 RepID=UPI0037B3D55E